MAIKSILPFPFTYFSEADFLTIGYFNGKCKNDISTLLFYSSIIFYWAAHGLADSKEQAQTSN